VTDSLRAEARSWAERLAAVGQALDAGDYLLRDVAVAVAGERVFVTALAMRRDAVTSAWGPVTLEVVGGLAVPLAAGAEAGQDWDGGALRPLPATAAGAAQAQWEVCRIVAERVRSPVLGADVWRFRAELVGPKRGVVAESEQFRAESVSDGQELQPEETPGARSAHHALVQRLTAAGWQRGAADYGWFGARFRRPGRGDGGGAG
jgi:hypothetical protein